MKLRNILILAAIITVAAFFTGCEITIGSDNECYYTGTGSSYIDFFNPGAILEIRNYIGSTINYAYLTNTSYVQLYDDLLQPDYTVSGYETFTIYGVPYASPVYVELEFSNILTGSSYWGTMDFATNDYIITVLPGQEVFEIRSLDTQVIEGDDIKVIIEAKPRQ
ncbi:MAG: hypothetical protein JW904_00690 [Spirochaetales bacterium]|nr:hypothetical protein [Spirochaetales bacterium]